MREIKELCSRKGFTIIELSFSIAFIAILSIIVILIISNAISAYHRGLTLNQLNTVGMDLVNDMRTTVQSSPSQFAQRECASAYSNSNEMQACVDDNGLGFVMVEKKANVRVGGKNIGSTPVYGVFCTGKYSYLWNSGYFFGGDREYEVDGAGMLSLKYKITGSLDSSSSVASNFKLLKVQDEDRLVCKIAAGVNVKSPESSRYNLSGAPNSIDISSKGIDEAPADILAGNNNLAIYNLDVSVPAEVANVNDTFYAVSFVLGTIQGGINVMAQGNYCAAPEDYDRASVENFDYCAINKFNFAAQAVGG